MYFSFKAILPAPAHHRVSACSTQTAGGWQEAPGCAGTALESGSLFHWKRQLLSPGTIPVAAGQVGLTAPFITQEMWHRVFTLQALKLRATAERVFTQVACVLEASGGHLLLDVFLFLLINSITQLYLCTYESSLYHPPLLPCTPSVIWLINLHRKV